MRMLTDQASAARFDVWVQEVFSVLEFDRVPNWCVSKDAFHQIGFLLVYCYTGHAYYTLNHKTLDMRAGDLLFLRRNEDRQGTTDPEDPWGFIVISFDLRFKGPEDERLLASLMGKRHMTRDLSSLFRELYQVWLTRRTGHALRCRNIVEKILLEVLSQEKSAVEPGDNFSTIDQAVLLMECNPQRTFTPAELAERCRFSEGYFRQQFKKYTGMSVTNYQNFLRINRAKEYLVYADYNVSQTAQALGFSNSYYFCRVFKKWTGQSPSEYKKSCKE